MYKGCPWEKNDEIFKKVSLLDKLKLDVYCDNNSLDCSYTVNYIKQNSKGRSVPLGNNKMLIRLPYVGDITAGDNICFIGTPTQWTDDFDCYGAVINSSGQVIDKIQSKVSDDPKWIAEQFEQVKYNDMLLNTTSDKVEKVRNILIEKGNYDAANRVVDFQSSNSENLDLEQVIFASKHPEIFSTYIESVEVIEEALTNGAYALVAGALIKGASDIIKGTYSDNKVKLSKDIITTAKRSGIVGLGGTIIRVGAAKQNLNVFNQGNVAVTIASGTINIGNVLMDFTKGNISGTKAIELIGQNGVSSLSSIFLGLASGSVLGPAGALVGSIGGYIISQSLYQSSISIAKNADLEKKQFESITGWTSSFLHFFR